MRTLSSRVSGARTSRLTLPLYAYATTEEFILLYPLYALLFQEHGLSVAQISSLFFLWSATGLLVAVPSGAWADVVPRRYLLAAAPLLAAAAFTLWLVAPSYWAFALGFVLWGAGGALSSGALEALVHTELALRDGTDRYAAIMGVRRTLGVVAAGGATLLAIPVMSAGGYPAVGAASVAACALCFLAGLALPEHREDAAASEADGACDRTGGVDDADGPDGQVDAQASEKPPVSAYTAALRAGLAEARASRAVRTAIVLVIVVGVFWGVLDEYLPLLAVESGTPVEAVPFVVLVAWTGASVGGLAAGPAARLPARALPFLLGAGGVAIGAGALLGGPLGWALIGVGFGACQSMDVLVDARLQDSITGPSRATVTSLAGLGTDALTLTSYAVYAGAFALLGHAEAFALFAAPYLLAAAVWARSGARRGRDSSCASQ
ncbi:MFS transporter [Nocardiopsis sp. EMB25]|uniref:MFS transporter n=1 Tax=Nocardiopsis sp. EMB25 TaxID=2835867 RepID=UPI0022853316|nr:MFS transporter [Nocardiopsis sp. EMB25]MCY9783711.1 MFS transporter [Nocardiopsis sp. EMB25]